MVLFCHHYHTHLQRDHPLQWKEDPKLGLWVKTQRNQCEQKHRIDLLNDIDFNWKMEIKMKPMWMNMYWLLVAYKKKHDGRTTVPRWWKEDPKLGCWVKNQRCGCKGEHRIDLLNAIGSEWQRFPHNSK